MGKKIAILLVAMLGAVGPAWANQIVQYAPDYVANPGVVTIPIEITNNDNGAIYNSYDLSLFGSLVASIYALPRNQANYASVEEMTATWQLEILPSPVGEVNTGWNATTGDYNPVAIGNIGGIPGLDYEQWLATQQNPNQDEMALNLYIPVSQLDGDGDGWSLADGMDYHLTTNSVPSADMGVGRVDQFTEYPAQGYEYGVVLNGGHEPATGRFEMGTMELGLPVLTMAVSPSTVTVIVQRCDGMMETNWQSITNLAPGTAQWTDTTATGAWEQLYYRLAK